MTEPGASVQPRWVMTPARRAVILFFNFFLIILAYYQLKPASRSLFIEYMGSEWLPYLWIASAAGVGLFVLPYQWAIKKFDRPKVVLTAGWLFVSLLVLFRGLVVEPNPGGAVAFYILVDLLSVVLVEQVWSLTDSVFRSLDGRRWYGFVGSGGLVGGMLGGLMATTLITNTPLQTPDLLWVAAGILAFLNVATQISTRWGLFEYEGWQTVDETEKVQFGSWRKFAGHRYLGLIAAGLLASQLAAPMIDYQFLWMVEQNYTDRESRTAFLSLFFTAMGGFALLVNLLVTPSVHTRFGAVAGLMVQPLLIILAAIAFGIVPALGTVIALKLVDRGLSYSINRASRELLYVPVHSTVVFRAKAWIDMFGYRLFKVLGALLILLLTQWLPIGIEPWHLIWLVLLVAIGWAVAAWWIRTAYHRLLMVESWVSAGSTAGKDPEPEPVKVNS